LELAEADSSEDVAQAIIVADLRMLVVRCGGAGLSRQLACPFDQVLGIRNEHPAAGRGDDLVAVEREYPGVPHRTGRTPLVRRTKCLRSILYHCDLVLLADGENRIHVGALAVEVNRYDCLWRGTASHESLDTFSY